MNKRGVSFTKIHGNGNDFVYFHHSALPQEVTPEWIRAVCHRHYGIGADGVLIQAEADGYDFRMIYYNSDGKRADFCGNGARCLSFLASKNLKKRELTFLADDGKHQVSILQDNTVALTMSPPGIIPAERWVPALRESGFPFEGIGAFHTGVPHLVIEVPPMSVPEFQSMDIISVSRKLRFLSSFPEGINVNFTMKSGRIFYQRSYERGVEDETLSCGTGSVAVALYWKSRLPHYDGLFPIETIGGMNKVDLSVNPPLLIGKVSPVFTGKLFPDQLRTENPGLKQS